MGDSALQSQKIIIKEIENMADNDNYMVLYDGMEKISSKLEALHSMILTVHLGMISENMEKQKSIRNPHIPVIPFSIIKNNLTLPFLPCSL